MPPNHLSLCLGPSARCLALNRHPDGKRKPWPHPACKCWRHFGQRRLLSSFSSSLALRFPTKRNQVQALKAGVFCLSTERGHWPMQEHLYCSFHVLVAPRHPQSSPPGLSKVPAPPTPSLPLLQAVPEGAEDASSVAVVLKL